jgi:hypothetical protein
MDAGFYLVEDDRDECGYGDYLHQFFAVTVQEAIELLDKNPCCGHADFWDGSTWHHNAIFRENSEWRLASSVLSHARSLS